MKDVQRVLPVRLALVVAVAAAVCACGSAYEGSGWLVVTNADASCPLEVILNDDSHFTVEAGRRVERKVRAGGQEIRLESTDACFVFTRHPDSPLDSGRSLCNTLVEDGDRKAVRATGEDRGTHREVIVECPN